MFYSSHPSFSLPSFVSPLLRIMALDSSSPDGKLRVLSLDGGGFRGLGALYTIDAIMKAVNDRNRDPTDPQLKPCDVFDWVLGASAGGLVAMLIGRLGLTCTQAIEDYKAIALALFGTNRDDFTRKVLDGTKLSTTDAYKNAIIAVLDKYERSTQPKRLKDRDYVPKPIPPATTVRETGKTGISTKMLRAKPQCVPSTGTNGAVFWSMKDLIQSATAAATNSAIDEASSATNSPEYLLAFEPEDRVQEADDGFIDIAYDNGGTGSPAINPAITALLGQKHFKALDVGVLVSMGQGFREADFVTPNPKPLKADVTSKIQNAFLGGVSDPNNSVVGTLLNYLKQAKSAQGAWETLSGNTDFSSGSLIKVDPPALPVDRFVDLADIFHADKIKAQVEQWVKDNNSLVKKIAEKLVKAKPDPETPDKQTGVRPYNPALDAPKPKVLDQYLSTYHVIFIVDDSTSMILEDDYSDWNDNRWRQAENAIGPIAQFAYEHKVVNIDMGFMHHKRTSPVVGLQSRATVEATFRSAKPPQNWNAIQYTPTAATLDFYLNRALDELDQTSDPVAYKNIRPTDIILLTDGEADDDPKASMRRARDRMDAGRHNHNYIGITIVQIGNSKKTAVKLQDITTGACGDMANLEPSNGQDLDNKKLERIMLGGIHPTVRKKYGGKPPVKK